MIKKLLIGTVIIFLLLSFLLAINLQLIKNLNNLKNVTLENISIEGKNYTLSNGKVYEEDKKLFWFIPSQKDKISKVVSLAGFYMWNKEDPLFYSPDLDVNEFESLVQILEDQSVSFQKDLNLSYDIFPIKFLHSIPKIKNTANKFIKNPSKKTAEELLHNQYNAATYYREDIQKRIKSMKVTINDKNKNTNLLYLRVATTPNIILLDYETFLDNAKELEDELKLREQCLHGKGLCQRPFYNFPALDTLETTPTKLNILSDEMLKNMYPRPNMIRTGPFSVTTPCLGLNEKLEEQKQAYFLFKGQPTTYPQLDGHQAIVTQVATEIFFHRASTSFLQGFHIKMGMRWSPESGTNTYGCPDLTYLTKLATMNNYIAKLNANPLFKTTALTGKSHTDKIIKDGRILEQKLLTEKIKDYDDFSRLENLYLQFYYEVHSDKSLINLQKRADTFLTYGLGMQRLLADFPLMFNRTVAEFISFSIYQRLDNINSGNIYLYGIRNISSFTYLTFSPSFWRIDQKPTYYQRKLVKNIGFDAQYLTYNLALTKYTKEEIMSWFKNVLIEAYDSYLEQKNNNPSP